METRQQLSFKPVLISVPPTESAEAFAASMLKIADAFEFNANSISAREGKAQPIKLVAAQKGNEIYIVTGFKGTEHDQLLMAGLQLGNNYASELKWFGGTHIIVNWQTGSFTFERDSRSLQKGIDDRSDVKAHATKLVSARIEDLRKQFGYDKPSE